LDSLGDLGDLFGGDLLPDSEERNAQLLEIAGLLDTAILTYQQHAHPKKPSPSSEDGEKFKVILNGIRRKSMEELEEEERLFHWRSSLALAYQNAATIATARNQHIRSRELLNHALELYTDTILPYYSEQDVREKRLKRSRSNTDGGDIRGRHRGRGKLQTSSPNSMSTMTRGYAEVSAGHLYVTLADTAMKLGGYEDSKQAYSKAMDWHMQHKLSPTADGTFNSLYGDEMGLRQYKDFAETYVQELEQYWEDLRTGYVYRDDLYEAQILLTLAPLYMAMGQAAPAIRYYKKAITAYESSTTGDLTNESNKLAVLSQGDSHFGLATAYFHAGRYTESKEQHVKSCNIYQRVYGEGTPPQPEGEAAIEDMKDLIIDNYGEEYYEQLKAYYDGSGTGTGGGAGIGGEGGSNPKLATNFDIQGYHNETLEEDIEEEEKEDYEDTGVNWSNDEL
jgi:tetratricopeptide (TPR) repeat protein